MIELSWWDFDTWMDMGRNMGRIEGVYVLITAGWQESHLREKIRHHVQQGGTQWSTYDLLLIFEVDVIIIIIINWWHILQYSDNHIDVQQFDLQFISHSSRVTLVLSFHHMWNEFKSLK